MRSMIKSDGNKSVCIMEFNKENSQEEYLHMAKRVDNGEYIIGYIAIHKPWYSPESSWIYYILRDEYSGGGLNGGAVDSGLQKREVDKNTVEAYTQTAAVKLEQSRGHDVLIVKDMDKQDDESNIISYIGTCDKIPYELWKN